MNHKKEMRDVFALHKSIDETIALLREIPNKINVIKAQCRLTTEKKFSEQKELFIKYKKS